MNKTIQLNYLLLLIFSCSTLFAQDDASTPDDTLSPWQFNGSYGLNMTQTSLTNWAAGGQSSISVLGLIENQLTYQKNRWSWEAQLDAAYGLLRQDGNEGWWKTDDRVELSSILGYKAFDKAFYSLLTSYRTQFAPGYDYPNDSVIISDFNAPGYVVISPGMEYKPKPFFQVLLSPATAKMTFVSNQELADRGNFGVEAAEFDENGEKISDGQTFLFQFGGYLRAVLNYNHKEKYTIKSQLNLFSNYLDKPQNIDVSWENILSAKISKILSVNFSLHLIYDDEIVVEIDNNGDGIIDERGPRVQLKQILGLGVSYIINTPKTK